MLHVIYLVFNEGYSASSGESLTRPDLSGEAIRLGRLLVELLPEPEAIGLLALMLLHESRRAARSLADGRADPARGPGPLAVEPRSRSPRGGAGASGRSRRARFGPYTLQAAIAAVHAERADAAATDWARDRRRCTTCCCRADPSPVVELNRAVAVAMRDGPRGRPALIDAILARGDLADYHLAHAARADLCRRLGRTAEPAPSYERALSLTRQEPERRFLERRLRELGED